jgi:methylthioribose-1-phosphate isomerase
MPPALSAAQSLLFEPVLWEGDGFRILDEIQLPEKIEYIEVSEVDQAVDAVRTMKTRAFGQVLTFLYAGALLSQRHAIEDPREIGRRLDLMTDQFCAARPTFDFRGLRALFDGWLSELPAHADPGESIAKQARDCARRILRGRANRARLAASLLPNPARLLTHCNVSGELVAVARYCEASGKQLSVLATETRPYLQGTRLTGWELARAGVPVSVIPDNAVAQVMEQGAVNAVIVGTDRAAQNGDIINKVGTYSMAVAARNFNIAFYALVQDPRTLVSGGEVLIEERPANELVQFGGKSLIGSRAGELRVRYPAFDVTPAALITRWIGFEEIHTLETFMRKYQCAHAARQRASKPRARYLLVYGVPPHSQYAVLAHALAAEQLESVLVPEMRPELWGTELVIPALLERGISTTLISDNMMGTLFEQGSIKKFWLFYDALTDQGPSAICGSQLAVRLAHSHAVEVELFQGAAHRQSTSDRDAGSFLGQPICPPGVNVHNVGAEVTPWSLLK